MVIGIWPILMGASMWVQQKLNPAPTDPIQAKIFAFFPLFLTIILASFPSGLVVYWTVNNILTIAQQWVINKNTTVKKN
jgi:YidC/Oxa1 family membrane protein insertase